MRSRFSVLSCQSQKRRH